MATISAYVEGSELPLKVEPACLLVFQFSLMFRSTPLGLGLVLNNFRMFVDLDDFDQGGFPPEANNHLLGPGEI